VRYLHDQFDAYFGRPGFVSLAARALRRPLAAWDVRTASRVDAFLANSENVRERIARLYGRPSRVVHPPADLGFFTPPPEGTRRSGFLIVSALAPYKRLEDAVDAAARAGFELTIAGFGPEEGRLRRRAGPTVRFAGSPTDDGLRTLYRTSEAVLMPGEEDFGIVPVEAQACGTPVVALGRGGARETVRDGITGALYADPGPSGLLNALERLAGLRPRLEDLRASAARFATGAFRHNLVTAVAEVLAERGLPGPARALGDRLRPRCV
jgi:glycosyltransferase involved in cell wall biosynthesis